MKMTKKLTAALLVATTVMTGAAYADSYNAYQTATAATAKRMADDTDVSISGTITKQIAKEKYELKDATGTIIVEIDNDDYRANQLIGKTVTIHGEVDVDSRRGVEIDADRVTIR